jgi:hypothetical protein
MTTSTWPQSDIAAGELRQMIEELRNMLQARKMTSPDPGTGKQAGQGFDGECLVP